LRLQYPGAIYHLMNRGDHQERIFADDQDRRRFLSTLEQCCQNQNYYLPRLPETEQNQILFPSLSRKAPIGVPS